MKIEGKPVIAWSSLTLSFILRLRALIVMPSSNHMTLPQEEENRVYIKVFIWDFECSIFYFYLEIFLSI